MQPSQQRARRIQDVGGSDGGIGEYIIGLMLLAVGGYWLLKRVVVASGARSFFGAPWFSYALVPLFIGVIVLFFRGMSVVGWGLIALGGVGICVAVLADLHVYFQPTPLLHTLLMFGFLASGIGMIFRAILPHGSETDD